MKNMKKKIPSTSSEPRAGMKTCSFCGTQTKYLDYKDYPTLKPYMDYFANIRQRYYTGVCLKHQKMLKTAVERSRFMAMLPYRK